MREILRTLFNLLRVLPDSINFAAKKKKEEGINIFLKKRKMHKTENQYRAMKVDSIFFS